MALFAGKLSEKDGKLEPQKVGQSKEAARKNSEKPEKLEASKPKEKCPFGFDKLKGKKYTEENHTKGEDPSVTSKKRKKSAISPKHPKGRYRKNGKHHKKNSTSSDEKQSYITYRHKKSFLPL